MSRVAIPSGLDWLRATTNGRAWLAALPAAVEECAVAWKLRLGQPFEYAFESLALRDPRRRDGRRPEDPVRRS